MSVRYITAGNRIKSEQLLGVGRHQLSILRRMMAFQELEQLKRTTTFPDGTVITCSIVYGQANVHIYSPVHLEAEWKEIGKVSRTYCWCSDWFAVGRILEVIGEYGDTGEYEEGQVYPSCCNSLDADIENYNGIRYKVTVCQDTYTKTYICLSSDFAEYERGERVLVYMRGVWIENTLSGVTRQAGVGCREGQKSCRACRGNRRSDTGRDCVDGSYLLLPLGIFGVNLGRRDL